MQRFPLGAERLPPAPLPAPVDKIATGELAEPQTVAERYSLPGQSFPLSYGQKSLWFMHQTMPASAAYNVGFAVWIRQPLNIPALRLSLQLLLDRHACLRSLFKVDENGELCQHVLAGQALSFEQPPLERDMRQALTTAWRQPFDLASGPLMRAHLWSDGEDRHSLLLTFHHIVFDGPSMFTLLTELGEIYVSILAGVEPALRPLKCDYREFVEQQTARLRGPEGKSDLAYWQEKLHGAPHLLDLPADQPRPAHMTGRGGSVVVQLDADLVDGIRRLSQDTKARLYDVLLAAYQVLLHRYSNQDDLLVGFVTSGRTQLRFAKMCGLFINTIVLRARFPEGLTFRDFLERQRDGLADALEHQDYPFLALVENSQVTRLPGCMPLVQALFNFFKAPRTAQLAELFVPAEHSRPVSALGMTVESFGLEQNESEFDLALEVADGARCWLRFRYNAELFVPDTIARMAAHYRNILRAIVGNPGLTVRQLPLMDTNDRTRMLLTPGYQDRHCPFHTGVHQLFEAQAAQTPGRVALVCGARQMTYAELNGQANALAHYLRRQGVAPQSLVGVCLQRSSRMVIALLAILKAGGAYVPLDPAFPAARLELILEDARPVLVLTESSLTHQLSKAPAPRFLLDTQEETWSAFPRENPSLPCDGTALAYVLFTSGSTGRPKGVQIPHRAFTNFQLSMLERPGLTSDDVLLTVTTISFDIAGLELFLPLIAGARIVIAGEGTVLDGRRLARDIREHQVSVMQATPATWRLLLDSGWNGSSGLKALCGGEALSRELANQLLPRVGELWNMYGPTETTVWSIVHRVEPGSEAIPLGTPIANTTLFIVDSAMEPVPVGVPGELMIGGLGVARGYLNRPDLTSARFVDNPFGTPGGTLYRTGDLCRWRPDGGICFLGRMDDQVKVRGHRIELGDIESALLKLPPVREAVVAVHEDPAAGKRLIAYLTEKPGAGRADVTELRRALSVDLPDYMVPSAFVYLDSLPLTPNNKVDRNALRAIDPPRAETAREYRPPRTAAETAVSELWRQMLHVERVGLDDRFDELGGDSLAFALMIVRLSRQLQLELPVFMDDEMMTVSGLAKAIEQASAEPAIPSPPPAAGEATRKHSWAGRILVRATDVLVRTLARVRCEGVEHVPSSGPLLLAGNHMSLFDFLVLGSALGSRAHGLPLQPAFIIADKWRNCVHSYAAQLGTPIYIRRGKGDLEALGGALEVLESKGLVAIMPEGRPSRQGLLRARPGVAWLATETRATVVPFAVFGHERAFRYWPRFRRVPVQIRIGHPFELCAACPESDLQGKADFIMQTIAGLMPDSYHGFYRSNPNAKERGG